LLLVHFDVFRFNI